MCRNPQRKVTDKHGTFNIEMASDDEFLAPWKNEVQQNNVVIAVINVITLQLGLGNWVGHELASGPDHRTGGTKKMAAQAHSHEHQSVCNFPGAPAYGQQVINLCVFFCRISFGKGLPLRESLQHILRNPKPPTQNNRLIVGWFGPSKKKIGLQIISPHLPFKRIINMFHHVAHLNYVGPACLNKSNWETSGDATFWRNSYAIPGSRTPRVVPVVRVPEWQWGGNLEIKCIPSGYD